MKRFLPAVLTVNILLFIITSCDNTITPPKKPPEKEPEKEQVDIESILSSMTTEQKIRQMVQVNRPDASSTDSADAGSLSNQWYGSVLSGVGETPVAAEGGNTPQGWVNMTNAYMSHSLNPNSVTVNVTGEGAAGNGVYYPKTPIPYLHGIDAVHGMTHMPGTTVLPHAVGLGAIAAGNLEKGKKAVYGSARIAAEETKAPGIRWTFAPVLGNAGNARWGRFYESWTENLELAAALAPVAVKGFQDQGVAACAKHFYGEGQTLRGQNEGNAYLTRAEMDDLLMVYKAAVDSGVLTLMPSYNSINGIRMHAYGEEMDRVKLPVDKGGMGFKGFVISDWDAVIYNDITPSDTLKYPVKYGAVFTGDNAENRAVYCVLSGVDMIMATGGPSAEDAVKYLRNAHYAVPTRLPMERIDDAVRRILYVKKELGLFDPKNRVTNTVPVLGNQINTPESKALARETVSDSLVLLKNKNKILDGMNGFKHILITGSPAHEVGTQMGGWSITWQGSASSPGHIGTSVLQGILEVLKANNPVEGAVLPGNGTYTNATGTVYVTYANSFDNIPAGFMNPGIPPFDVVIGVLAETPYSGDYGDVRTGTSNPETRIPLYDLPSMYDLPNVSGGRITQRAQRGHSVNRAIIEGFAAKDRSGVYIIDIPKIVLLVSGRPHSVDIHLEDWDALIAAWLPGSEAGGIADVLFGNRDFTGKTPVTWYGVYEVLADPDTGSTNGKTGNITFPFGWGLKKNEDLTHPHQVYIHNF